MEQNSQLARLGLFDARVPRYTSYPTAPHFSQGVGPEHFRDWIAAIPEGEEISLYLHVPFCSRLCWFCACRTQGTQSESPVRAYVETLKSELALFARHLPAGVKLGRLHWGGGTPTLLPPDAIAELAGAIAEVTPFAKGAEFSVEIDPNEIDAARLDALTAAGMNRASIGVQDFDPEIQKAIGREQSFEQTRVAVMAIRERGVTSLNADILFGLPDQTPERIVNSVQKLLDLSPDRVALYGYAHVPWMSRRQQLIRSESLPTPQERLALFVAASELFRWDGYVEIGIDHFARPGDGLALAQAEGRLRRNFQGYTDDASQVLVGLGASSISRFPQGYAQNAPATGDYTAALRSGAFATRKGHVFRDADAVRGRIIEALMCDFAVDKADVLARAPNAGEVVDALFADVAHQFGAVVTLEGGRLSIPLAARPLTRIIARAFDAYDMASVSHSSAI